MNDGEPFPYEPFFRGPVSKRSCTDIICCMTFVAAIVSYMLIGILALLYGDPRHVLLPRNSTGMFCGSGVNFDKPNVLYFDVLKCARATTEMDATLEGLQCPTTQVCVKKCPSEFWKLPPEAYAPDALPKDFFQQQYCDPRLDLAQTTIALGKCLPSFELQDVPPDFSLPGFASVDETVKHIKSAMEYLMFVLLLALIVGVLVAGAYGIYYCYREYNHYRHSKLTLGDITYNSEFSVYLQVKETWLFFCKGYQIFSQDIGEPVSFGIRNFTLPDTSGEENICCIGTDQRVQQKITLDTRNPLTFFFKSVQSRHSYIITHIKYLDHRFRDCRNFCCQFVMMSLKCCFWFLDKFLKFFHRNTYIMIAIHGNNFHVSGKNAYMLLRRNINRVVVLDCVTDTLLFSGKVLVVGLVGLLAFFFFSGRIRLPDDNFQIQLLHYYWLPVITVMAGAYLIAQGFFSVYSMCVDTLFLF
ncbi:choline transporter-like protein 4 [Electrophorus electricus]|uniref:choline transporter-like protein 4 n=1 Tax=Electrophorus electricus TaxID=8005 RepID=UPI0015CF89CC|nr:choline transporter-like protein 4 [Electrophorus electricus]